MTSKLIPAPGFEWNPLKRHRNVFCPCDSGKKAKHCHGIPEALPIADVNHIKDYLRRLSAAGIVTGRKNYFLKTRVEK